MELLHSLSVAAFVVLVVFGAWNDARELRIPNWVSLSILAVFLPASLVAGIGLEATAWHLGAGVMMLVVGIALFGFGLFGGGDAKLLAAVSLWAGWDQLFALLAAIAVIGGALSVLVILLRKGLGLWPDLLVRSLKGLFEPNAAIPYGIAITAGALIILPRMALYPPSWADFLAIMLG